MHIRALGHYQKTEEMQQRKRKALSSQTEEIHKIDCSKPTSTPVAAVSSSTQHNICHNGLNNSMWCICEAHKNLTFLLRHYILCSQAAEVSTVSERTSTNDQQEEDKDWKWCDACQCQFTNENVSLSTYNAVWSASICMLHVNRNRNSKFGLFCLASSPIICTYVLLATIKRQKKCSRERGKLYQVKQKEFTRWTVENLPVRLLQQ